MDPKFKKIMTIIVFVLLFGMTLFETVKQLVNPDISIWESHTITIIFSTIIGSLAAYFALKRYDKINRALRVEITRRERVENDLLVVRDGLDKTVRELQKTLDKVNLLSGLLPICAHCKKIRSDKGRWVTIEKYIEKHSEAAFSHSICDECARILYPEEFESKENGK